MKHDKLAVIDFGGQYAHLITTKFRRLGVLAEICQPDDATDTFRQYKGIVISGSPSLSSHGEDSEYNKEIYDLDLPIIGFCFGHQELAKHYGGAVMHGKQEWGRASLHVLHDHVLFKGLSKVEQVWMSHFDSVSAVGPDFEELGYSVLREGGKEHRFAAIFSDKLRRYGFQYHPEVDDTVNGDIMLQNFAFEICKCQKTWSMENYLEEQKEKIREQVGENSVFLLVSGGVDSTVAAKLIGEALGSDRLHLLHIDNGLMRKDESAKVIKAFKKMGLDKNFHFVDASADFLKSLDGLIDPEEKRTAIGNTFIEVFEREAKALGLEQHLLGQGTIYPDTIETGGTKRSDTIKTHHNRVPIIEEMIAAGKVIEPLAELYKVEVRELGEKIGIAEELIDRHPFPGPGLGVRLLCSGGEVADDMQAGTNAHINELLSGYGLEGHLLPIKSVGVKADLRSYERPVLIHGEFNFTKVEEAAGLLFKNIKGINRALLNLSDNMPQAVKPLVAKATKERLDLLREVDYIVMQALRKHKAYDNVWQCPTVFIPLEVDGKGKEFCIIRPVLSERGMTASIAHLEKDLVLELKQSILALPGISGLAYDLTSKPPGTIEWE